VARLSATPALSLVLLLPYRRWLIRQCGDVEAGGSEEQGGALPARRPVSSLDVARLSATPALSLVLLPRCRTGAATGRKSAALYSGRRRAMSPVLEAHFTDYAAFHGTPGNRACHYVGIPLIVVSLFALLSAVPLFAVGGFTVTLAEVLLVATTAYYLRLDPTLAALMLATSAVAIAIGRHVPTFAAVALFVAGWIFQFVGHYVYEKRAPAFYRNLAHLLVGPLWILAKATGRA
jgi:uncharacterized membrane protein YGL010W